MATREWGGLAWSILNAEQGMPDFEVTFSGSFIIRSSLLNIRYRSHERGAIYTGGFRQSLDSDQSAIGILGRKSAKMANLQRNSLLR